MSEQWYCPKCGVLQESDVTLIRMVTGLEQDEYCECSECGDVVDQNVPPFVRVMQEEIATLQAENAALQRKLVSARLANRAEPDLSGVDFGAPHLRER